MAHTFTKGMNHGALVSQRRHTAIKTARRPAWNEDEYEASIAAGDEEARAEARKRSDAIWAE